MALKAILKSLEGLSDELKKQYVEKDGAYHLDADGLVPKDRVDEFRNNNIDLKKQLDDLKKTYEGIDVEQVKELLKKEIQLKEKKLIDSGKVDELLEERTKSMKTEYEKKIKELSDKVASSDTQLERLVIDNAIQSEAVKSGVRDTAMEDVLLRGRARFKLQDGKAVPLNGEGKTIYGKDGSTPESMTEWVSGLSTSTPHLFKPSTGGGTNGNNGNGSNGAKTMKRADFDALDQTAKHAFAVTQKGQVVD